MTTGRTDLPHEQTEGLSYLPVCVLCVALGFAFSFGGARAGKGGTTVRLQTRVNPNEAPAASLVRLPQIGITRAERIIAYRQARAGDEPVFRCVDDLQNVEGIGPAIAAGLSEYLIVE